MHSEDRRIDRSEKIKYKHTFQQAGKPDTARIYYKDDGSIDEERTYSKSYLEELHPKAKDKPKKDKPKKEKKKKEGRSWFGKLICWILSKILPSWLSSLLGID